MRCWVHGAGLSDSGLTHTHTLSENSPVCVSSLTAPEEKAERSRILHITPQLGNEPFVLTSQGWRTHCGLIKNASHEIAEGEGGLSLELLMVILDEISVGVRVRGFDGAKILCVTDEHGENVTSRAEVLPSIAPAPAPAFCLH